MSYYMFAQNNQKIQLQYVLFLLYKWLNFQKSESFNHLIKILLWTESRSRASLS